MVDNLVVHQPCESATQVRRNRWMAHCVSANMRLVEYRPFPRRLRSAFFAPGEGGVNDTTFWHERRAVPPVEGKVTVVRTDGVAEQGIIPLQVSHDLFAIRIKQQLVGVEPVTFFRRIGAMDAITVDLPRPGVWKIAVPYLVGIFGQFDALQFLQPVSIKQAKLDFCRIGGKQGEVHAEAIPGRTQREWAALLHAVLWGVSRSRCDVDNRNLVHWCAPRCLSKRTRST